MKKQLIFLLILIGFSCTDKTIERVPHSILFLGHTYASDTLIDQRIAQLNLDGFEHVWLGGDICANSDGKKSTLAYINKVLKVDQPDNYWALGNHDVYSGNYEWIRSVTGKPDFYTRYHKGMTVMVLNTNLEAPECDRLDAQADMFQSVCDTIQSSSHLLILTHHIIWNHVKGTPNLWKRANSNHPYWASRCEEGARFEDGMYQKLVEVQNRGVQVIFISGDYGQKEKSFQIRVKEGVWFLASGLDRSNRYMPDSLQSIARDKVLALYHEPSRLHLSWEFLDLDSLVSSQTSFFELFD